MKAAKQNNSRLLAKALRIAAIEAYQSEVVETEMVSLLIGPRERWANSEDWIQARVRGWLEEADLELRLVTTGNN